MKYIRQLDSIRAIAVFLVIISHWFSPSSLINYIPNGAIGVDIFFVLSGFLITSILLENKKLAEAGQESKSSLVKNFYARRFLRIFPVYYIFIFLLLIFHEHTGTNIKSAFPYFVTYTSNYYFFNTQQWDGMLSHLWSLSVEEQFYLVWPWVIIFVRERFLLHSIIVFILVGLITQYIFIDNIMSDVLTSSAFDSFGLGALLAWQIVYGKGITKKFYKWTGIAALLSLIFGLAMLINKKLLFLPARTHISIMALWLITYVVYRHNNDKLRFKWLFNNSKVIFFGKISYGVYLYHNVVPALTDGMMYRFFKIHTEEIHSPKWLEMLIRIGNFVGLVFISWLSWKLIEKPFLSLKKYFDYKKSVKV
ncbi:MAG: acyltransferase [Bacteroidetes bacterium]|nr:acyltransferase [Bacteroidota bacterium]